MLCWMNRLGQENGVFRYDLKDIRVDSWYLKGDSEVEMPIRHERVEAANIFFLARLHQSLQR